LDRPTSIVHASGAEVPSPSGILVLGVEVSGNPVLIAGFVVLGALTFTSIGYVIASFARTEEAANGMTSIVQFPLMFLSGIFFPLEVMPEWLRGVATFSRSPIWETRSARRWSAGRHSSRWAWTRSCSSAGSW
jgi:hypothetical protein